MQLEKVIYSSRSRKKRNVMWYMGKYLKRINLLYLGHKSEKMKRERIAEEKINSKKQHSSGRYLHLHLGAFYEKVQ